MDGKETEMIAKNWFGPKLVIKAVGGAMVLSLLFAGVASACMNPTDSFAVEVVLNVSGISYDLSTISQVDGVVVHESDDSMGVEGIVYRAHHDSRVAVILSEAVLEPGGDEYLSVRIQIPTQEQILDSGLLDLQEAVDISAEEFAWQEAMQAELTWLQQNLVIVGLDETEIAKITAASQQGVAGHNRRLVFEAGSWMPYNETSEPAMLLRQADCSGFALDNLPQGNVEDLASAQGSESAVGGTSFLPYGLLIGGAILVVGGGVFVLLRRRG
jgi:hypothetical protein